MKQRMTAMYELTQNYLNLLDMAAEVDADDECIKDTFEALEGEIEVKAENCMKLVRQELASAKAIDAEIKRLQTLKKSHENAATRIKKIVSDAMIVTGKRKFKTPLFSFWIQANPPKLVLGAGVTASDVPEEYITIPEPEINNEAVKKALKEGKELTWARLEQTESLRYR